MMKTMHRIQKCFWCGLAVKSLCDVASSAGFAARTFPKYEICLLTVTKSGIIVVIVFPFLLILVIRLYCVVVTMASNSLCFFSFS